MPVDSIGAPQELTAPTSGDDIVLTWRAVEDATSYNVYASPEPDNFTDIITTATDTTVTLVGESMSQDIRFYRVTAVR